MTRFISAICIVGGFSLVGLNLYELGRDHQREEQAKCQIVKVGHRVHYSAEEHRRIARAIERNERIKP